MYKIYRIIEHCIKENTGKSERIIYITTEMDIFDSIDRAKEYIIRKSTIHTDLIKSRYLHYDNYNKYVNDFCFDDDQYLIHRRYFLNKEDAQKTLDLIKQQINEN